MKYLIVESARRLMQMIFSCELFSFPGLMAVRKGMYRLCFKIGKKPVIDYDVHLSRSHQLSSGTIKIGNSVLLSKHVEIDYSGNVVIGDNVWLSEGVRVFSHNHLLTPTRTKEVKKNVVTNSLVIEDNVWIGANAVILPSVTHIGKNSIVGAGAIVTKNVDDNCVVAGNPAKLIRKTDRDNNDKGL